MGKSREEGEAGAQVREEVGGSSWFYCGNCGFKNHPRQGQDNTKCEQCGAPRDHPDAHPYTPQGG